MATRTETNTVYVAGLVQGIVMVTFPAASTIFYGICETMNGNWSQIDMTTEVGASTTTASLALTAFWAMVTIGRVLFASIQRWFPTHRTYHVLPFVLAGAFVIIAALPEGNTAAGVFAFGLAGLGCSALLPLTISFAQADLVTIAASTAGYVHRRVPGGLRPGRVRRRAAAGRGVTLPAIFGIAAVAAGLMAALSFVIARPRHQVAVVHPRPL